MIDTPFIFYLFAVRRHQMYKKQVRHEELEFKQQIKIERLSAKWT